ncbi:MAG: BlaI/MecI/CopY family transcriptional regulator [Clostridia bacterium]|nr:BlaI/MecI/CopY family transcriptional regulator [Clostridia bacterium]
MKQIPRISDTEWNVMKILWEHPYYTAMQVYEALKESTAWKPNTVRTLLSRLVAKGIISYKEDAKTYFYFPLVTEEQSIRAEGKSFLQKVYNGALNIMLTNFIEENNLTEKDIKELEQLLQKKKTQRR